MAPASRAIETDLPSKRLSASVPYLDSDIADKRNCL